MSYSGNDGITFYIGKYDTDSLNYSFAYESPTKPKDTVFLNMRIAGAAKDYDRTISMKAGEGTTARAGVDYQLPDIILPAGALTTVYPVVLLNSPEMKHTTFRLVVEVAAGKDFVPGATGQEKAGSFSIDKFVINVNNQLTEPGYWIEVESLFGPFSVVKFQFMVEVTGLTDFSYEAIGAAASYSLPVKLRNALEAYEAVNGPLLDEFNNPITF